MCKLPETMNHIPQKAVLTGTPIRKELFSGNKIKGLDFAVSQPTNRYYGYWRQFRAGNNDVIRGMLPTLLRDFQVVHLWVRKP